MEARFSPRQTEIVSLIASGYSDKQIALHLRVSQRTVRTQLERLYATNGLHCRAQAVHMWALSAGFPSPLAGEGDPAAKRPGRMGASLQQLPS